VKGGRVFIFAFICFFLLGCLDRWLFSHSPTWREIAYNSKKEEKEKQEEEEEFTVPLLSP